MLFRSALLSALRRTDGDMAAAYRLLLPQLTAIRHSSLNALVLTDTHVHVLCRNIPANRPDGMGAAFTLVFPAPLIVRDPAIESTS